MGQEKTGQGDKADDIEGQEIEMGQDCQNVATALIRFSSITEVEKRKKQQLKFFSKVAQLNPLMSANYGGSISFLTKYVKQAVERISNGPRNYVNPEEEFYQSDLEMYCRSEARELENGVGFGCKLCDKKFKSLEFVVTHIKNKH